jgi:Spy/CpxP family protein refolding chaperone
VEYPCHQCHATVEEGVAFCPHCGAPQIRVIVPESDAQAAPPPPPAEGAQNVPAAAPQAPDPIARNLFAPEQIMAHQEDINLTPEQRTAIRDEMRKAQSQFTDLQWQLEDAVDAMGQILKPSSVDEKAALAQLEKVLDLERSIKRAQMGLMIRIKNKLTQNQQMELASFARMPAPPTAPPRNPPIE